MAKCNIVTELQKQQQKIKSAMIEKAQTNKKISNTIKELEEQEQTL